MDSGSLTGQSHPEVVLTDEQVNACRAVVRAFGRVSTYGGGCQVLLRLPDGKAISGTDGWLGIDAAIASVAHSLARRFAEQTYHDIYQPIEAYKSARSTNG